MASLVRHCYLEVSHPHLRHRLSTNPWNLPYRFPDRVVRFPSRDESRETEMEGWGNE